MRKSSRFYKAIIASIESTAQPKERPTNVEETFASMCYDDPVVSSDVSLKELGMALSISSTTTIRLCDSFVNGTIQAMQRTTSNTAGTDGASSAGYAEVALALFVRIPLEIIQASEANQNLQSILTFLGSYSEGHKKEEDSPNSFNTDIQLSDTLLHNNTNNANDTIYNDENDDEVWAAEEDPDDFAYESGWDGTQHPSSPPAESSEDAIEVSFNRSWEDVQSRVYSLISHLEYSNILSCISTSRWKQLDVSKMLHELMTLLFSSSSHHPLTECWPRIVFILRDRVLDPTHDLNSLHDFLYMTLANIWNMAAEATVEKYSSSLYPFHVPLFCLSSICQYVNGHNNLRAVSEMEHFLTSFVNSKLVLVLEQLSVLEKKKTETSSMSSQVELLLPCVIMIVEFIARVPKDDILLENVMDEDRPYQACDVTNSTRTVNSSMETSLLTTGLLREYISFYTTCVPSCTNEDNSRKNHRIRMLNTLFQLCISSDVIRNYIISVPAIQEHIHAHHFVKNHSVDAIVWCLLSTCTRPPKASSNFRQITNKNNRDMAPVEGSSSSVSLLSIEECILLGFQITCQNVSNTLLFGCINDDKSSSSSSSNIQCHKQHEQQQFLRDFLRFTNILETQNALSSAWCTYLTATNSNNKQGDDVLMTVKRCTSDVKDALLFARQNPTPSNDALSSKKVDDDAMTDPCTKTAHSALVLAGVKRGVKTLLNLILEAEQQQKTKA